MVHFSLFPPNADLAPVAQVVAAQQPDIVAVGGHDVLLVDFVKAMAATGYTPKAIIEHYGITDASFAKALGRQADGVMGISVWLPTATFKDDLFGSAGDYAKAFEAAARLATGLHRRRVQRLRTGAAGRGREAG